MPGYLNLRMEVSIFTVDGLVHKFPAAWQRKKVKAFRDAVVAAQQTTGLSAWHGGPPTMSWVSLCIARKQ